MIRLCRNGHITGHKRCALCGWEDTYPLQNRPEDRARTPEQIAREELVRAQMREVWAGDEPARKSGSRPSIRPRYRRVRKIIPFLVGLWPRPRKANQAVPKAHEPQPSRRMMLRNWRKRRAA